MSSSSARSPQARPASWSRSSRRRPLARVRPRRRAVARAGGARRRLARVRRPPPLRLRAPAGADRRGGAPGSPPRAGAAARVSRSTSRRGPRSARFGPVRFRELLDELAPDVLFATEAEWELLGRRASHRAGRRAQARRARLHRLHRRREARLRGRSRSTWSTRPAQATRSLPASCWAARSRRRRGAGSSGCPLRRESRVAAVRVETLTRRSGRASRGMAVRVPVRVVRHVGRPAAASSCSRSCPADASARGRRRRRARRLLQLRPGRRRGAHRARDAAGPDRARARAAVHRGGPRLCAPRVAAAPLPPLGRALERARAARLPARPASARCRARTRRAAFVEMERPSVSLSRDARVALRPVRTTSTTRATIRRSTPSGSGPVAATHLRAVVDDDVELVGFFYFDPEGDEVGSGSRPDLCGRGLRERHRGRARLRAARVAAAHVPPLRRVLE